MTVFVIGIYNYNISPNKESSKTFVAILVLIVLSFVLLPISFEETITFVSPTNPDCSIVQEPNTTVYQKLRENGKGFNTYEKLRFGLGTSLVLIMGVICFNKWMRQMMMTIICMCFGV